MSTTDIEQKTEGRESGLLVREFVATDLEVKGRTVDVCVVPFGEVARVYDSHGPKPTPMEYDEEWLPGAFDHQLNAANRIHAKYGHSRHVIDVVGHGLALRCEADGYHVSTKIHETAQGDTTLELLRGGALPCVSLEAAPVKSRSAATGVVQRVKAHLTGFAFCRQGAFAGAQVLAIREQHQFLDEVLVPVEMDPKLVERLRAKGIVLPDRYSAHPADTGTPADAGTPGDGTRQSS